MIVFLAASLAAALVVREPVDAQVRPVYDLGAAGLTRLLERLQTTASALHTGAHPDDEDSAFIARTARGDAARMAYLSLNRGEGGQNIIGPELFDALGVIRTEELLQARRLDGGEQFFTRTFDYGFSKTRAEAAAKWNERDVLGDMVRVIRLFRPLVIYSRFQGTPADGHGQHQLAGYLTPLAFKAAADPNEFPEQLKEGLRPWQARKLYRGVGFRPDPANPPTTMVATGVFDPVLGRTFAEIAAEGRSQHKSQQMGAIELKGPQASGMRLRRERRADDNARAVRLRAASTCRSPASARWRACRRARCVSSWLPSTPPPVRRSNDYDPLEPHAIIPPLAAGLRATRAARAAMASGSAPQAPGADADFLLSFKEHDFVEALALAAGVVVDPLADEETVVQGGTVGVTVRMFAADGAPARVTSASVTAPAGWKVDAQAGTEPGDRAGQNPSARMEMPAYAARYRVTVPADAPLTAALFPGASAAGRCVSVDGCRAEGAAVRAAAAHRAGVARHRRD